MNARGKLRSRHEQPTFKLLSLYSLCSYKNPHLQQTCAISCVCPPLGPRSRPTVLSNTSSINEKSERVKAASHRPFDDSSRMNACCACTSRNCAAMLACVSTEPTSKISIIKSELAYGNSYICVFERFPDEVSSGSGDVRILAANVVNEMPQGNCCKYPPACRKSSKSFFELSLRRSIRLRKKRTTSSPLPFRSPLRTRTSVSSFSPLPSVAL